MLDLLLRNVSLITYIFLLNYFFAGWNSSLKKPILNNGLILGLLIISAISGIFFDEKLLPYINIIISISVIFVVAIKHFLPIKEILFWIVILMAVNFICETLSVEIVHLLFPEQYSVDNQSFQIVSTSTSITSIFEGLILIGIKMYFIQKGTVSQSMNISSLLALGSIPIISIVILYGFLMSEINVSVNSQFLEILVTTGIVLINIGVLYLYNNLSGHLTRINRMMLQNKALESEIRYIDQLKRNQQDIQEIRHDLKNRFLVVLGLIEKNDLIEAKEYLQQSIGAIESPSNFYTTDSVLNYLLNEKISYAKIQGISFDTNVFLSENTRIDNDILAIIIGNLIDNSIQACLRGSATKQMDISLRIKQFDNDLLIDINNSFNPSEFESRKNRYVEGIGIRSISTLVDKLGGIYKHWTEGDRYFSSVIILNIY